MRGQMASIQVVASLAASAFALAGAGGMAIAQVPVETAMEIGGSKLSLSGPEMQAISDLGKLARTGQRGAQDRALAIARRAANGRDARYALALWEFEIGKQRGDDVMRAQALDALIVSGLTPAERLPGHLSLRGGLAFKAGDMETAGRMWARLVELQPNDPDALANLAQVRVAQKDAAGASELLERAISARKAAGGAVSEAWYRQRLIIAQQGDAALGFEAARDLLNVYPTAENWRVALVIYRQLATPQGSFEIDLFRFMRHVGALSRADEYQRMTQLLRKAGHAGEAKTVIEEGVARRLLDPATSPTREIIAEVDRTLAKERAGLAAKAKALDSAGTQVRLGMSQLIAGRRMEAEAAFRSAAGDASSGHYADLAQFWLAWLAQEPQAPASA